MQNVRADFKKRPQQIFNKRIIMIMIFHKYLWLVWYGGMIVETNGDQIPGAILSFMEEYLV